MSIDQGLNCRAYTGYRLYYEKPLVGIYKKMQSTRFVYVFVIVNPNRSYQNIRKDIKESLVKVFNVRLNYLNNYLPSPSRTYAVHTRKPMGKQWYIQVHINISEIPLLLHNVYCVKYKCIGRSQDLLGFIIKKKEEIKFNQDVHARCTKDDNHHRYAVCIRLHIQESTYYYRYLHSITGSIKIVWRLRFPIVFVHIDYNIIIFFGADIQFYIGSRQVRRILL